MRVRSLAGEPGWIDGVLAAAKVPENLQLFVDDQAALIRIAVLALLAAIFAARAIRGLRTRSRAARLTYGDGRIITIRAGATVLEMLRAEGIPHPSVCGGRGRCSTCRVRLGDGADQLPPSSPDEQRVLDRVAAPAGVRLACQIRPTRGLAVTSILPPTATAEDGFRRPRYLQGQECEIAVLFADMRGFTRLADGKLPYDVVFILNRYFEALGRAVEDANGRLDKFIGDGVMALFGIESGAEEGCRRALVAARAMAARIDELNGNLVHDLPQPLRIGVGIHVGPVIVGEMGYGKARSLTAIGDAVNIASRLESLTKDLGAFLVISEEVARHAGVAEDDLPRREVEVRGRAEPMAVRVVASADELARIIGPEKPL
jgi:adenylate cyclase